MSAFNNLLMTGVSSSPLAPVIPIIQGLGSSNSVLSDWGRALANGTMTLDEVISKIKKKNYPTYMKNDLIKTFTELYQRYLSSQSAVSNAIVSPPPSVTKSSVDSSGTFDKNTLFIVFGLLLFLILKK